MTAMFLTLTTRHEADAAIDDDGIHWPRPAAPKPGWHRNAKCANADPNKWDLPMGLRIPAQRLHANRTCYGCPVVQQCAADALRNHDRAIIRAGVHIPDYSSDPRPAIRELAARAGIGQQRGAA